MLNWLRRLWHSRDPEDKRQISTPPAEYGTRRSDADDSPRRSEAGRDSVGQREPVLVRGRLWVNTSETGWELPRQQQVPPELSIADLGERLLPACAGEVRRSAAERLGQLEKAATPAIPALVIAAVDEEALVRQAAMDALEAIDPAWPTNAEALKSVPDLVAALRSSSEQVYQAAFRLLRLFGKPVVPALSSALVEGEDTIDQIRVIRVLARIDPGAASAVPGLTRALSSQFLHVRIAAARLLAKGSPPPEAAIPMLVAGLTERSADARRAMAVCLARAGASAEPAIPSLMPLLADRNGGVRVAAESALKEIGSPAIPALIELIEARDVQRLRAWAESKGKDLSWYVSPGNDTLFVESWDSWRNLLWTAYDILAEHACLVVAQEAALRILGELGPASSMALPAVAKALAHPSPGIQLAAVNALGQFGAQASGAIPELVPMLGKGSETVRKAVVEALDCIDQDWASDPAVSGVASKLAGQLTSSGSPGASAVETFAAIGAASVPALIATLTSGNRIARENAARALGCIGPDARAAIPALTQALQDPHPWVQEQAAEALAKIEEQAA